MSELNHIEPWFAYNVTHILVEIILLPAPRCLDQKLRDEQAAAAGGGSSASAGGGEGKGSGKWWFWAWFKSLLMLFYKPESSWLCNDNCIISFILSDFVYHCHCAQEVEVTLEGEEKVFWPKQVALVAYPTYKQFEAQRLSNHVKFIQLLQILTCFDCMLSAGRPLASSMGWNWRASRTLGTQSSAQRLQSGTSNGR